ncbi:MAG: GNAT family N-acetyltransferase [Actinomycetes bacterium]
MLEIVRAKLADVGDLHPLVEKYRAFYKQPANEKTLDYLKSRLVNDEAVVFIARDDSVAVGFTMLYPTFSTVSLSNVWLLNDLYVDEAGRGRGIASKLMEAAESAAREAGATRVFLRTANDNTTAQSLYEGRGYIQDEVFRRYDLIF